MPSQISKLNDTITEKENHYHREVERITAQADRDGWEMRRQLDKLTSAHIEQIEKLKESHEKEVGKSILVNCGGTSDCFPPRHMTFVVITWEMYFNVFQNHADSLKEAQDEALNRIDELESQLQESLKNQRQSREPSQPSPPGAGIPVEIKTIKVVPLNSKVNVDVAMYPCSVPAMTAFISV